MVRPFLALFLGALLGCILPPATEAAIIFKPGEKAKYVAPGEEEINGNAQELFQIGQEAENKGNLGRAIKAYRTLVKKYPRDALAPGAGFRCAQLEEKTRDYLVAAGSYRWIVERYPHHPNFNEAIEAQFRIGELYLNGKKIKFMGISVANALDRAVEIFASIIRTAPYGKYTARAQFNIGRAREKEGAMDAAIQAYQAVIDKFSSDPIAADAQYQIGYIWFVAARSGTKDIAASEKARTAFQDFLFRYPNSEKAAQAKTNLGVLQKRQINSSYDIARFYDKQKHYRAAVIYYNEVIRQLPGSSESEKAKKRIDELRSKVGEDALKSGAAKIAEIEKGKGKGKTAFTAPGRGGGAAPQGPSNEAAPLPAAENESSLPPPASPLAPAASGADHGLGSTTLADPSPSESSTAPDATPSPAP